MCGHEARLHGGCDGNAAERPRMTAAPDGCRIGVQAQESALAADRRCRPLSFVVTPGQAAESPRFVPVLEGVRVRGLVGRPRTRSGAVAADKAYSSRANRSYLRRPHP